MRNASASTRVHPNTEKRKRESSYKTVKRKYKNPYRHYEKQAHANTEKHKRKYKYCPREADIDLKNLHSWVYLTNFMILFMRY